MIVTKPFQRFIDRPLHIAVALFGAALALFVWVEHNSISHSGFWTDELFSLWAGDPRTPFSKAFAERILPDTNPPLYFSLIHFMRGFIFEGRAAIVLVNAIGLTAILGVLLWRAFAMDMRTTGLLVIAFFLVGAPALCYAPEGRSYVLAMAATTTLAFIGGARVVGAQAIRTDYILAAAFAALSTWLHVYGAIFAGALGAGLVLVGWLIVKRADIVRLGFAAGLGAVGAFVFWIAFAYPMFSKTVTDGFWLPFTPASIIEALWTVKQYTIGLTIAAPLGAGFIAASLWPAHSRAIAALTIITGATFFLIPFLASFHTVIFLGRYVLVGMPAVLTLCLIVLRTHLIVLQRDDDVRWTGWLALAGALFLLAPVVTGASTAAWHFQNRWDWRGMDVIGSRVAACPEKKIRVLNSSIRNLSGFEYLLAGKLQPIDASKAPIRDVRDIQCPVLGWAEHYLAVNDDRYWADRVGADEALAAFHLTNNSKIALQIDRHPGGLVLRRAEPQP
jgi:hypothetical protein